MVAKKTLLKLFLLLAALESTAAFVVLLLIPSDPKNILFGGYSLQRLLLLTWAVSFAVSIWFFLLRLQLSRDVLRKAILKVDVIFENRVKSSLVVGASFLLICFGCLFLLIPFDIHTSYAAHAERISPVIYMVSLIGAQSLLGYIFWCEKKINWHSFRAWKKLYIRIGVALGFILIFSIWVTWTGIGLLPEKYGWHYPGAPIIFPQLLLAWLFLLPFIIWCDPIEQWMKSFKITHLSFVHLDVIICFALWFIASFIWWSEPMRKDSYFTPTPTPPNFEYYPHSDAAIYDLSAQNILIGADQNNRIILRPLYAFFLSLLHVFGGQRYGNVIFFQILFLAFTPALAYLIASLIVGRPAGLLTAIVIILREQNAIALTNIIEISHSKLYMSDAPTMAFMLLLIYALFKWLRKPSNNDGLGVFAGASFGLVMLIRSHQSLFVVPALLIGMAFSGGFQIKRLIQRILMFTLGFAVVTAPWIWRNYEVNGKPAIESSEFYIGWYAGAYTEPTDSIDILPGESSEEYSARIKQQVFQYILHHPVELTRVYISYFIRNEVVSIISLPMSLKIYDVRSYVSRMHFWSDPLISFGMGSGLIFFITLGIIVVGVSVAVQRLGFLGFLPLLVHFSYNFSMSIARISGWRFVQPVDWILQLYYCVGLVVLTVMVFSLVSNNTFVFGEEKVEESFGNTFTAIIKYWLTLMFFVLLGLSLPLAEIFIPQRYSEIAIGRAIAENVVTGFFLDNGESITRSDVKSFLETDSTSVVLYGRALYPAYYQSGEYWGDENAFSLLVRSINRLQFVYIGSENVPVFIPMDTSPQYFPNASDVIILGCREDAGIRALAVKVNDQPVFIGTSPWRGLTCSTQ